MIAALWNLGWLVAIVPPVTDASAIASRYNLHAGSPQHSAMTICQGLACDLMLLPLQSQEYSIGTRRRPFHRRSLSTWFTHRRLCVW